MCEGCSLYHNSCPPRVTNYCTQGYILKKDYTMAEIKAVEYYPSNKGLKNIYSKFLKFGSTEDFDNLILLYQ